MEWINFKESPPKEDIQALVTNSKGWMFEVRASYRKNSNVWILYDPNYQQTLLLDVTHYLPIPVSPRD